MTQFIELTQAVNLIQDSSTLALGGMTLYRRPVAFVLAMLKREQRPKDLTLLNFTAGYGSDLLVGAGCVSTVRTVYFGLETFGLAPMFTQAANSGQINIIEETEASIIMGIRAQVSGVGFMPSHAWVGTDIPALRPDVNTITDPYTDETLMAFPAIPIDIAVLHGLEADKEGNVLLNNNLGIDMELVSAADLVIASVERIVDAIEMTPIGKIIPNPGVDYIVHAPQGAYPTSCYPFYHINGGEFMRYVDACNAGKFNDYVEKLLTSK